MILIRTAQAADAPGIARVHERTWKESYRGILEKAYLEGISEQRLTARWRTNLSQLHENRDEAAFVAASGRDIIGFVTVGASREAFSPWDGEITMVYVLKEYRGGGLGRELMKAAADHCIRRGMFSAGLWVLRDNGAARDFYEALQGEHAGRKTDDVGGRSVPLVGYWWRETAILAERATPSIAIRRA
jgi:ribosomal protein S18 acetylase RimI-like enzyme